MKKILATFAALCALAGAPATGQFIPGLSSSMLVGGQPSTRCTGGTITLAGGNVVHSFTASGSLSCATPKTGTILVVAGGGAAGGGGFAGGGGAGGMCEQTLRPLSGALTVTVGAGGLGVLNSSGNPGNDSVFDTITAKGGGLGGKALDTNGGTGGSGGGGASNTGTGAASNQTTPSGGATCFGNAGGNASGAGGGGGGGAGGAGGTPTAGLGRANTITGASVTYAAGGVSDAGVDQGACVNPGDGGPTAGGGVGSGTGHDGCNGRVIVSYPDQ